MASPKRVWTGGLLSAIAGALFVPYGLSKGYLTSVIITENWGLMGLTAVETAQLFHVLESVPLMFMMLGLVALGIRIDTRGTLAKAGVAVTLAGFGVTVLTHLGEHLLTPFTVPALTGGENWFMWAYYLSWLTLYSGLALYGGALVRTSDDSPRWLPRLFVSALPAAVVVGLVVTVLDVFTTAGTFRVIQGLMWVVVGRWLWVDPEGSAASSQQNIIASRGTDDR